MTHVRVTWIYKATFRNEPFVSQIFNTPQVRSPFGKKLLE